MHAYAMHGDLIIDKFVIMLTGNYNAHYGGFNNK